MTQSSDCRMTNNIVKQVARYLVSSLLTLTASCSHYVNTPLCEPSNTCGYDPKIGYRFHPEWKMYRETLFIVTLSGGGTRAAALAYGALRALSELPSSEGSQNLLEDVDIVSSVSGGSVTAAWYALHGPSGFTSPGNQPLIDFLHTDGTARVAWRGLNPIALGSYLFTDYQRSDVLADYFDDELFHGARYADISARYSPEQLQGYVILNATDLGHETRFAFTQDNFDLICSDLSRMRLADATAASADFPFFFSAVGIQNNSPCAAQTTSAFVGSGPPVWIKNYDKFDPPVTDLPYTNASLPGPTQLAGLRDARIQKSYMNPLPGDVNLHLLDGGLADNLGIQSTLDLADNPAREPGLRHRIGKNRPPGYAKVNRVLYLVVSARTKDPTGIDTARYPPDEFSTALRVVDTPLDNTQLDMQTLLTAELSAATGNDPRLVLQSTSQGLRTKALIVTVDFEFIPDQRCRNWYWALGTNWHLSNATVDALIALGRTLVKLSPALRDYIGPTAAATIPPQDFSAACHLAWDAGK
jgi:NTE family protein